jgi:hypothetical protein
VDAAVGVAGAWVAVAVGREIAALSVAVSVGRVGFSVWQALTSSASISPIMITLRIFLLLLGHPFPVTKVNDTPIYTLCQPRQQGRLAF